MSKAVQEFVTRRVIELLEQQNTTLSWTRPWVADGPHSNIEGRPYKGVNQVLCYLFASTRPDSEKFSNKWATLRQITARGGSVLAAEMRNYVPIVLYRKFQWTVKNDVTGKDEIRWTLRPCKFFKVWNIGGQTTGIDVAPTMRRAENLDPIEGLERLVENYKDRPSISFSGDSAFYSKSTDRVQMPDKARFNGNAEAMYMCLIHELGHATGAAHRLNRKSLTEATAFGSEQYSTEEVTTELAALWVASTVGIKHETFLNSSAYIKSWTSAMKSDSGLIFKVCKEAQRIFDWFVPSSSEDEAEQEENTTEIPQSVAA